VSLALVFSPQGSQAIGMGHDLAQSSTASRTVYQEADAALGWSVSTLCWEGPEERLNDTRQTQPCLLTTSIACLRALEESLAARGLSLAAARVAGHSVGEYAALVAAGSLTLGDALALVARRGELMADAGAEGGMRAVIGLDRPEVARVVAEAGRDDLVVANDNAPGQVVLSGSTAALDAVESQLTAAGARRVIPLRVSGPFHSPLMAEVGRTLGEAFGSVPWRDASPPVVSNVTAQPTSDAAALRELLERQVSAPVEWVRSVRGMVADGIDTFVELGPGAALVGMIRRIAPGVTALSVSSEATLATTAEALAGRAAAEPVSA
jgi:[acyl-carrier-protein] S-malonyltransferase